jgi:16S rRNA (cytosine1402-N4)-methyltransferase
MLAEAMEHLVVRDSGIYIDATLGGGGYSEAILSANPSAIVFGFDTDPAAWRYASQRLEKFGERFVLVKDNFAILHDALFELGIENIDGIVYDLGVSSHQLDTTSVGLSYRVDAPLDMRLDPRLEISAKEVIAEYDESQLKQIFRKYGEEPYAGPISRKIIQARSERKIETTTELAAIITKGIREDKKNETLSRIFQALRIEVNRELESLSTSLAQAVDMLRDGGRIVVVSYHSLEDRIVKEFFKAESAPVFGTNSVEALKARIDLSSASLKLLTKKPLTPSTEEIERNQRARSAKLRAAEKIIK